MSLLEENTKDEKEALDLLDELERWHKKNKLECLYADLARNGCVGGPYDWQAEFHAAGRDNAERAIIAGNQSGKTRTAAAEIAIHTTGLYPKWWKGRVFQEPVSVIIGEPTNELSRDIAQLELLGPIESDGENRHIAGTGWIPFHLIGKFDFRQCGVSNVLDTVEIRHKSGGFSTLSFKSYEQGAVKFQGVTRDIIWMDEEPETEAWTIYSEAMTRILYRRGLMLFTRTPLFGATEIIRHFMSGKDGVYYVTATWEQAPHLDEKAKEQLAATYAEHERDTRISGVPLMGSGAVYPCSPKDYVIEPIPLQKWWRRICGIDFGIDHPAAACWIAFDPDADTIYVYDCYRQRGQTAAYHADAIKARGKWIPCAWPHDGMFRDKGGGVTLSQQYADKDVNMLPISACYDEDKLGGQPREPATLAILERMRTGRIKVFSHLSDLLEELRMLHRKDGKIVAERDDIESALRYAVMMLRYADTQRMTERPQRCESYDPFESVR